MRRYIGFIVVLVLSIVGCSPELYVKMDITRDPFYPKFVLSSSKHFNRGWRASVDIAEVGENGKAWGRGAVMWSIEPVYHGGWFTLGEVWSSQEIVYGTVPPDWTVGSAEEMPKQAKSLRLCTFYAIRSRGEWFFLIGRKDGQYYNVLLHHRDFYASDFRKMRDECSVNTGLVK